MNDYKYIYSQKLKTRQEWRAGGMLAAFLIVLGVVGYIEQPPVQDKPVVAVAKSETQQRIEKYLPAEYARPIAEKSTYPITMAAIAHTETVGHGYNHRSIGDGGKSRGLFQVQPRFWGPVPLDDLEMQVAKADAVFCSLVRQYGYRLAVKRWNGDGPDAARYQRIVLAKVEEMQR